MEIVTKNEGEAVALAAALQRLSPTPVDSGKLPAVRGDAVNGVTKMLAEACLSITPMEMAIAKGIIDGTIQAAPVPKEVVKKAKRKAKKHVAKKKAKAKKPRRKK